MPLTTQQKAQVNQFVNFTSADKKLAEKILKSNGWDLELAVESYFSNNGGRNAPSEATVSALNKLFDKYRDSPKESPDAINMNGTISYLTDLQIGIEDIGPLVLFELLQSPSLGEITRSGYQAGWSPTASTTISAQRTHLQSQIAALPKDDSRGPGGLFRRVYKHTFKIACPVGAKSVPLEMAAEYWKLLFGPQGARWTGRSGQTPWLDWWLWFLDERWKKAVNRDLWDQTLLFEEKTREDESLGWWSEDAAWPGVIDEFVAWVKKEKIGATGDAMEVE